MARPGRPAGLLDARNEGHALAVLQASEDGQGVYARIGFVERGRYIEYQPPPMSC